MENIIEARGLTKHYGSFRALDNVNFSIASGSIAGLIGPNGAGKTTALKSLLGLCEYDGDLMVAGRDPSIARHILMQDVCFIADVGILPKWLKVSQIIDFVEGVHPRFNRGKAEEFLSTTEIQSNKKINSLSKGMVTQLHLALVMAIDVKLLVLDEPTLGLDIIYRKEFYDRLLNDYFDNNRTIIISTHQVEEIEALLTHLLFVNKGKIVLDVQMSELADTYREVVVMPEKINAAEALAPIYSREVLGKKICLYEGVPESRLQHLGELHTPTISDLFVAKMKGGPQ